MHAAHACSKQTAARSAHFFAVLPRRCSFASKSFETLYPRRYATLASAVSDPRSHARCVAYLHSTARHYTREAGERAACRGHAGSAVAQQRDEPSVRAEARASGVGVRSAVWGYACPHAGHGGWGGWRAAGRVDGPGPPWARVVGVCMGQCA